MEGGKAEHRVVVKIRKPTGYEIVWFDASDPNHSLMALFEADDETPDLWAPSDQPYDIFEDEGSNYRDHLYHGFSPVDKYLMGRRDKNPIVELGKTPYHYDY